MDGRGEEESRLHFRDPHSGYIVIPRDVERREEDGVREKERKRGRERTRMRETRRDTRIPRQRYQMYERAKETGTVE